MDFATIRSTKGCEGNRLNRRTPPDGDFGKQNCHWWFANKVPTDFGGSHNVNHRNHYTCRFGDLFARLKVIFLAGFEAKSKGHPQIFLLVHRE